MIDGSLAGFLSDGVAIHVGTRDERLQPEGARALAAEVEPDGRHLVVYVSVAAIERLVPNLESNGQVAVVFVRPTDDRSCQVKGVFIRRRSATDDDRATIEHQWDGFLRKLEYIGIPRLTTREWPRWPAEAITIRVTALFDGTPGPQAGAPLA
jgi:hypothetical protein